MIKDNIKPKVSVIVPTYNCAQYLPEALDSALNQTFQDFEIIIVDDGSTDATRQIAEDFCRKYLEKIRYLYQDNKGLAVARNTGIRNAHGEYIALLDADDKWLPERLAETVAELDSETSIGLVHANITRISEKGQIIRTPHREIKFLSGKIFNDLLVRRAHIACPTVLFRKICCDQVGLFDENLTRLGSEDRDLWLRIAEKYQIQYIHKVLAYYRERPSGMSRHFDKMLDAQCYVINKYCTGPGKIFLRLRALARVYRERADYYLAQVDRVGARHEYINAIKCWPFDIMTFRNLIKTFRLKQINYQKQEINQE